jgi:hypothetical protein
MLLQSSAKMPVALYIHVAAPYGPEGVTRFDIIDASNDI